MRTMTSVSSIALLATLIAGCGGTLPGDPTNDAGPTARGGSKVGPAPSAALPLGPAWDGRDFVMHEWGTNTVVVGSNGELLQGLHHEEEGLPSFVYDRVKGAKETGKFTDPLTVKMETPVAYFYSPTPIDVNVHVDYPSGVLTQWYPAVVDFAPNLLKRDGVLRDPVLDMSYPFVDSTCRSMYAYLGAGRLDWGTVHVLGRESVGDARILAAMPAAPLDKYTWAHARNVASNPVTITSPAGESQTEGFLFYRGLGRAPMPASITAASGDAITITGSDPSGSLGATYILRVTETGGAFVKLDGAIPYGGARTVSAPDAGTLSPIDAFVDKLAASVTSSLDEAGLYHDESAAMVATWRRQWFRTPGVRVLYLAPQAWIDGYIPITLDPPAKKQVRVMLIRNEVLTPSIESADAAAAAGFDRDATSSAAATSYFHALGRFEEPRLRRALKLQPSKVGDWYLSTIIHAPAFGAPGE